MRDLLVGETPTSPPIGMRAIGWFLAIAFAGLAFAAWKVSAWARRRGVVAVA